MSNLIKIHGDPRSLKTAVVCTLAPSRIQGTDQIIEFFRAGMRIVRLNFSHVEEFTRQDQHSLKQLKQQKCGHLNKGEQEELNALERKKRNRRERAWKLIEDIRKAESKLRRPIGIMMDLCGPRLRTGPIGGNGVEIEMDNPYTFKSGPEVVGDDKYCSISSEDFRPDRDFVTDVRNCFSTRQQRLRELTRKRRRDTHALSEEEEEELDELEEGFFILINDGRLKFKVEKVDQHGVYCRVVRGGELESRKGVNVPSCALGLPAVTRKDIDDLNWIFKKEDGKRRRDKEFHAIDFIAQSFVKSGDDIKELRPIMAADLTERGAYREVPIVAKLETREALNNLAEIVQAADGAMVARGDLGVEISMEKVPKAQRDIINMASLTYSHDSGGTYDKGPKFVIVATQMMESMIREVQPLRAEVTDINTAVREGADGIMTSAETIEAEDPVEVVKRMVEIAKEAEKERDGLGYRKPEIGSASLADIDARYLGLAESACILAQNRNSPAIVVSTYSGRGAKILSSFRPAPQIIALTSQRETAFNLLLYSGVCPVLIDLSWRKKINTEAYMDLVREVLEGLRIGKEGDEVACFFGIKPGQSPIGPEMSSNTIRLFKIERA